MSSYPTSSTIPTSSGTIPGEQRIHMPAGTSATQGSVRRETYKFPSSSTQMMQSTVDDRYGKHYVNQNVSLAVSILLFVLGFFCTPAFLVNGIFLKSHQGAARVIAGCSLCLYFVWSCALCMVLGWPALAALLGGSIGGTRNRVPYNPIRQ